MGNMDEIFPPFRREYFFDPSQMGEDITYAKLFMLMHSDLSKDIGHGVRFVGVPGWVGESIRYRNYEKNHSGIAHVNWVFSINKDRSSINFSPSGVNMFLFPHFGVVLRDANAPVLMLDDSKMQSNVPQSGHHNYHPPTLLGQAMKNDELPVSEALLFEVFLGGSDDENITEPVLCVDNSKDASGLFGVGFSFEVLLERLLDLVGEKKFFNNVCVGRKNLLKLAEKMNRSGIGE